MKNANKTRSDIFNAFDRIELRVQKEIDKHSRNITMFSIGIQARSECFKLMKSGIDVATVELFD